MGLSLAVIPGLSQNVSQRASDQRPVWDRLNSDCRRAADGGGATGARLRLGTFETASTPYYRLAKTYPLTSVGDGSQHAALECVRARAWLASRCGSRSSSLAIVIPALRRARPEIEPWRVGLIAIAVAWFIQANFTPLDYAFDNYVVWLWAGVVVAGIAPRREPAIAVPEQPVRPPAPAELDPVPA